MKKLLTICLLALAVCSVRAQFLPRPQPVQLFTNSSAILVEGITTSNFPVTMAYVVPLGKNGTFFEFGMGGTNATTTTNATVLVELVSIDTISGLTNVIDNQTYTLSIPQNGTTRYDFGSNILATTANYGNAPSLRIRSMQNTNTASVWITNAVAWILQ